MYNTSQKERYLNEREATAEKIRKSAALFFAVSEPMEDRWGKDCSTFTINEIKTMYNAYMSRSLGSLRTINTQLKIYTSWCISQNLVPDNQNHYAELDDNDLRQYINQGLVDSMVISRDDLLHTLQSIPNVSDQFLALAIFEGLGGVKFSDFHNLSIDNIEGNEIVLSDRRLTVSKELIALAEKSSNEYEKYEYNRTLRYGYLESDTNIIKQSHNAKASSVEHTKRMIQTRLYSLEENYGKAFSYAGLRNSGRIHYVRQLMETTNDKDITKVLIENRNDFELRYGTLQSVSRWVAENEKYILD